VESGKWQGDISHGKTRKALNFSVMPAQAGIHAAVIEGDDRIRGYGVQRLAFGGMGVEF